jgi:hypothetical protein
MFAMALLLPMCRLFAQSELNNNRTSIVQMSLPINLIDNNNNESYYLFDFSFKVSFEKRMTKSLCPIIQIGYHGPFTFDIETQETQEQIKTNGLNLQFGNKSYFNSNNSPTGFYMSPQFIFNTVKLHEDGSVPGGFIRIQDYGLVGLIGYQIIKSKGFAIDIFSGAGIFRRNYFDNTLIENPSTVNHNETGIRPHLGIKFGYAF